MSGRLFGSRIAVLRNPGFWFIVIFFIFITAQHYQEALEQPAVIAYLLTEIGLTRHAFERILYLIPIFLAGFLFGWRGSFSASLAALVAMLPRALFFSNYLIDALFETLAIFFIGLLMAVSFEAFHIEKKNRRQLEDTCQELKESEESYRQLFDNAYDAIFIHDLTGYILAVNRACKTLTGYDKEELLSMKMADLLEDENWMITRAIEQLILSGEEPYTIEARLIRKDKDQVFIHLSIDLARGSSRTTAFQCTARDISEQKRMQENLRYYLQQATRAQEDERKRIALELHDETIQELVVLSRQIDQLIAKGKELTPENSVLLKELKHNTLNSIRSLRQISQDLRPATLDRLGLLPALGFLAAESQKASNITTSITIIGTEIRLSEEVELTLFRISQEALRNIGRHSHARETVITLEFDPSQVRLTISDDGMGFNPADMVNNSAKEGKLGLVGMRERARLIGGQFHIDSEPGKGTVILVEVPTEG